MEDQISKISQNMEEIKSNLQDFKEKLTQKDQIIGSKDERIAELTEKLVVASKEKDDALWAKIELMKEISAEREQKNLELSKMKSDLTEHAE